MSTILLKHTHTQNSIHIYDKYDDGSDEAQNVFDRLPVKMAFRHKRIHSFTNIHIIKHIFRMINILHGSLYLSYTHTLVLLSSINTTTTTTTENRLKRHIIEISYKKPLIVPILHEMHANECHKM